MLRYSHLHRKTVYAIQSFSGSCLSRHQLMSELSFLKQKLKQADACMMQACGKTFWAFQKLFNFEKLKRMLEQKEFMPELGKMDRRGKGNGGKHKMRDWDTINGGTVRTENLNLIWTENASWEDSRVGEGRMKEKDVNSKTHRRIINGGSRRDQSSDVCASLSPPVDFALSSDNVQAICLLTFWQTRYASCSKQGQ